MLILQNLNLSINPSEIVGLLGPNGAGKSVTFKVLLGIMKADKGEISVSGTPINNLPVHERSSKFKIGYIPQNESIFTGLSCESNLKAIAEIVINNQDERQNIVENLLTEFSLNDVRKVLAKNLSGGQKKKLVIARALINKPRILLMDEVFSAVDPITIEVIKDGMTDDEYHGYLKGNVLKYVSRYKFKGEPLEDLQKAQWYLNKLVVEYTHLNNFKEVVE